jgi:hypothetical protein
VVVVVWLLSLMHRLTLLLPLAVRPSWRSQTVQNMASRAASQRSQPLKSSSHTRWNARWACGVGVLGQWGILLGSGGTPRGKILGVLIVCMNIQTIKTYNQNS